jgi:hypothetical protein
MQLLGNFVLTNLEKKSKYKFRTTRGNCREKQLLNKLKPYFAFS